MIFATKTLLLVGSVLALGACSKTQHTPNQNITIDNGISANSVIETLPPDESSATPSNQLVNGNDNPDVTDLNGSSNTD